MKRKLNSRFATLTSLLCALICAVIAGFSCIFGGLGAGVQTADAIASGTSYSLGSNGKFTASVLTELMGKIMGRDSGASYTELKSYINADSDHARTASEIDAQVTLGGNTWNAVHATKDKSGDVIVTLWLATTSSKYIWNNWYASDSYEWDYPSNMYSSSYARALLVGGQYAKSSTKGEIEDSSLVKFATLVGSNWTTFLTQYGKYIDTPSQVAYQETEDALTTFGENTNRPNEAYGTPARQNWNSRADCSAKSGYADWQYDELWLPSLTETGRSDAKPGIWGTTATQRRNSTSSVSAWTWLRSGHTDFADCIIGLDNSDGVGGWANEPSLSGYIRPAFHLNLKSAATAAGLLSVDKPTLSESSVEFSTSSQTFTISDYSNLSITLPTGWSRSNGTITIPANTAAKTYYITVNPATEYSWSDGSETETCSLPITIDRATLSDPSLAKTSFSWSSSRQSTTISNYSSYTSITFSSSNLSNSGSTVYVAANAAANQSYSVYITPDSNHKWSDNTTTQKTLTLTVGRANISEPTLSKSSTDYSQSSQDFTISSTSYMTVTPPTGWTISGTKITIPAGKAVGSYSVSVTPDSNHQWSSGSNVTGARLLPISIGAKDISSTDITLGQATYTYSGSPNTPTVTVKDGSTTLTNDTHYTFAYSDNINAGTGKVTVTGIGNYTGTNTANFTINQATPAATPTIEAGTYIAGNQLQTVPISGTAKFNGSDLGGTFYWTDPSTLLTVGSASYSWTFTPNDADNFNSVTANVTVAAIGFDGIRAENTKTFKAFESFTTEGLTVYAVSSSASDRAVTGYTYTVAYSGGRDHFVVADSGTAVVTITYSEGGKTETTTITVTVEKADYDMSSVSMLDSTVTYDGTGKSITYTGTLPTGVTFAKYTYDGTDATEATNAGTYEVKALFTIADNANYNMPELKATLEIKKATPTATAILSGGAYYVGDELSGVTVKIGTSSVGGSIAWTHDSDTITGLSDSYGWTFTPNDTDNYNKVTGTLQVTAYYKLTGITVSGATTSYKAHESFDPTGMTVTASYATGKADTDVADYTISYPTAGATEFVISDDGKNMTVSYTENGITVTAEIAITIVANEYDMTGVTMTDLTVTYDGEAHSITYTGTLPKGVKVTGYKYNDEAGTGATNAGTYEIVAVIKIDDPDNYKLPSLSATLVIEKAKPTLTVSGVKTEFTYTGNLVTINSGAKVDNTEQTIKYTNNTFTTVTEGDGLKVKISVDESDNYLAASETVTLTVHKAAATIDVSKVKTDYVYTGKLQKVESGATVDNDEQTVFYSNNTFTTVEQGNGLEVKISVAESDNYLKYSTTVTITVDKASVENSVTFKNDSVTYDKAKHYLEIDGELADDITVTYLYNGAEFKGATDVGSYEITVHFECTSGNYYDPKDMKATLTITPYEVSGDEVGGIDAEYAYKGEAWKPAPTVEVTLADGKATLASSNYTVSYSTEDFTAGTQVTVTLVFSGNYDGTITKTFEIVKAQLEIEWNEGIYTYNGLRQGVTAKGVKGLATTDAGTMPTVTYSGNGLNASSDKPKNAGHYTATAELAESLFANYEYAPSNVLTKSFEIKKADVSVTVDFKNAVSGTLYEGCGLPEIEVKGNATAGSLTVTGSVAWQQTGNEPPALELGANDYVWIFTPDDEDNFNVKTGAINITAQQTTIENITVAWRTDITVPELYTSTTLAEVRDYLEVKGELSGGKGFVNIVGYQITGSWGSEPNPATDKAGTYFYTVAFNGKRATLNNVVYNPILITDLKVEAATADGIKTTYEGLDKFDKSSIKVTVIYNDGTEVEVKDYKVIYPNDHEELWAGDKQVIIAYNNGSLDNDMQWEINGLTVKTKEFDTSSLTIKDLTTDYDGTVKSYAIKGEFTIGTVSYTYAKQDAKGEWQTVAVSAVKDAGTYRVTVKFTLEEGKYKSNYEEIASQDVTLTINKVDYANVDLIGFSVTGADYDSGKSVANKIVLDNVPEEVKAVYEYRDASGKVVTADQIVNAGEYTVTVTFETDNNHYGIAPITTKFTVNKAKPSINPTVGGSLSKGTKLYQLMFVADDNDTKGSFAWVNDEQELQAGINRCYYTFTPGDSTNYESVKAYIDLNVGALSEGVANGGTVSTGLTVAVLVGLAVCLVVAIIALVIALKKPKATEDSDGFYEYASEEDLK
ncbi:MAG: MBG domain-containing protein [Clostridia bacterium]|nr:MBG domain-containing protein [Clostridia bacterium]